MEILLIRHARPLRIEGADGRADPGLDAVGKRQAGALARFLAREGLDALYTSPLRRAFETAAAISTMVGYRPVVRDGLAEWDRDTNSYIHIEELRATGHPVWTALAGEDWGALGVDPDEFRRRVVSTVDEIAASHPSQRVAVICHGGVINCYTAAVVGIDRILWTNPDYTSVSRVLVSRDGARSLATLNETAHLVAGDFS